MSENNNNNCSTCLPDGGGCGTGDWSGPAPGDPNLSDLVLTARNVRGGIDVLWTYPTINPGAVAHTKVFRNTEADIDTAVQITTASGNQYFDKVIVEGTYYYWIRMVSIHGTIGDLVGPASAVRANITDELTNDLDGSIDESLLDDWLSEKIRDITKTYDELNQEIRDRVQYTDALAEAIASMGENFEGALTVIDSRVTQTIDGQTALVERQDTLAAANANNTAAILNIQNVMVTEDSAWAQNVTETLSEHNGDLALIKDVTTSLSNDQETLASTVSTVSAVANGAASDIISERNARVTADQAFATQISSLNVAQGQNAAAIQNEQIARVNGQNALATNITTVQTNLNGRVGGVETEMRTKTDNLTGQVTSIYGAKVQSGNLIGGFALVNDGVGIHAGFNVDNFWIGRLGSVGKYPFEVKADPDNGNAPTVFMKNAVIQNAAITFAKIKDLEVDTIKITNGAVNNIQTFVENGNAVLPGNSTWKTISEIIVYMNYPGTVIVSVAGIVTANGIGGAVGLKATINGTEFLYFSTAALSGTPSGPYPQFGNYAVNVGGNTWSTIRIEVQGSSPNTVSKIHAIAQGVKK